MRIRYPCGIPLGLLFVGVTERCDYTLFMGGLFREFLRRMQW